VVARGTIGIRGAAAWFLLSGFGLAIACYASAAQWSAPPDVTHVDRPIQRPRIVIQLPEGALASVPAVEHRVTKPPPLIILLHGAGQSADQAISQFEEGQDCTEAVILAPKSLGLTWDVIAKAHRQALDGNILASEHFRYSTSKDAGRVTAAIAALAERVETDASRSLLMGFSDGASFALALGTGRDRPFSAVVALSPGLSTVALRPARGRPVLVIHGEKDRTLPFAFTRSTIVPALRSANLAVRFVAFSGGHEMVEKPLEILSKEFPTVQDQCRTLSP
jgi:phospholipase/carboxylesterase